MFRLKKLVLQPTTFCNLDCEYCYLPYRSRRGVMDVAVTRRLAEDLSGYDGDLLVIWHGGEPLAAGLNSFATLAEPLLKLPHLKHAVQTNATLITAEWCSFFAEEDFRVGISMDGPGDVCGRRTYRNGRAALPAILDGIDLLRKTKVEFHVIAVAHENSLGRAGEIYGFFRDLGCSSVGFNIEEREGVNSEAPGCNGEDVYRFWSDLFLAWKQGPNLGIREFRQILLWMSSVCTDNLSVLEDTHDIFPTVGVDGSVVVLSPELLGGKSSHYNDFIVGNVLRTGLLQILREAESRGYVQEFLAGVEKCRQQCPYFSYCGGGQASNKFYELGRLDVTETEFCRNSKQRLVDAVLDNLEGS